MAPVPKERKRSKSYLWDAERASCAPAGQRQGHCWESWGDCLAHMEAHSGNQSWLAKWLEGQVKSQLGCSSFREGEREQHRAAAWSRRRHRVQPEVLESPHSGGPPWNWKRDCQVSLSDGQSTVALGQEETQYLGFQVGQGHIKPLVDKVEAIKVYMPLNNWKQLRSFLGLAN